MSFQASASRMVMPPALHCSSSVPHLAQKRAGRNGRFWVVAPHASQNFITRRLMNVTSANKGAAAYKASVGKNHQINTKNRSADPMTYGGHRRRLRLASLIMKKKALARPAMIQ